MKHRLVKLTYDNGGKENTKEISRTKKDVRNNLKRSH